MGSGDNLNQLPPPCDGDVHLHRKNWCGISFFLVANRIALIFIMLDDAHDFGPVADGLLDENRKQRGSVFCKVSLATVYAS